MIDYIQKDFESHALRASLEVLGMLIGVGMSILLAVTTPYPPMLYAYIGWLISAALLGSVHGIVVHLDSQPPMCVTW